MSDEGISLPVPGVVGDGAEQFAAANTPAPPRVWTVFVVFLLVCVGVIAAQIPVTVWIVVRYFAQGGTSEKLAAELPGIVSQPWNFIALAASSQLVLAAAALLPAWLSPVPLKQRLGLVAPQSPAWAYGVFAIGAWLPALVGLAFAYLVATAIKPDSSVGKLYEQMNWQVALPFILFIALAPGCFEELLFRGYVQRRLLQRWPAWLAIGITSVLFALLHVTPHAIVFAFPIGVWLGIIAWRTGSVWPSIVCHAFINGSWNVYQIGTKLEAFPHDLPLALKVTGGTLIVACFLGSFWLLRGNVER